MRRDGKTANGRSDNAIWITFLTRGNRREQLRRRLPFQIDYNKKEGREEERRKRRDSEMSGWIGVARHFSLWRRLPCR